MTYTKLTPQRYRDIILSLGNWKQFDPDDDNYFVVFNHKSKTWRSFSINDGWEAPDRTYLDATTASLVEGYLNAHNYIL
jgi:hypothetical protein